SRVSAHCLCAARTPTMFPVPEENEKAVRLKTKTHGGAFPMNKFTVIAAAVGALGFAALASAQTLKGPVDDSPITENWFPTKWGAEDRAGSSNHTENSANIKRALATVKQFKAITVGKYYHREAPAFGARGWTLVIPGTPTGGPFGKNALIYHDEFVSTEIGQISTQFDGPGHIGVNTSKGPMMYNGRMYP